MFNKACIAMIIATLFLFSSVAVAIPSSDISSEPSLADTGCMELGEEGSVFTPDDGMDFDPSVMQGFFTENEGQWSDDIRFIASTGFGRVVFMDDSVIYDLPTDDNETNEIVKLTFVGSYASSIVPSDPLDHRSNFFIGNDEGKWQSDVINYAEITYKNAWEGIDVHYFFSNAGMKYEFILAPYSDVDDIRISVDGADISTIGDALSIETSSNRLVDDSLCAFYSDDGEDVMTSFIVHGDEYSFDVDGWDDSRELIIDPLVYSTYVGGSANDCARSIAIDSSGNAFVAGYLLSSNFPTTVGAFQTTYTGGGDVFILKLNTAGSALVYSTCVGGSNDDYAYSIAIDSSGNAFVAGYTGSSDFNTTAGAFQMVNAGGYDAFILKLEIVINDTGSPTFTSTPEDPDYGRESLAYHYNVTVNETSTWTLNTDATFLSQSNGSQYCNVSGTPSNAQAGTYYVNISACSVAGPWSHIRTTH